VNVFNKKRFDAPKRRLAGRDVSTSNSSSIFKRNRTLTGTTSNRLDSTNVRSDLESPRVHAHHLAIKRRKILSILLVIFMSIVLLWILISNFTATVIVSVPSTTISKPVDSEYYGKVIQEYLNINPMSRLQFFLDQSALTKYVSDKLPEVANVKQQGSMGIGETDFSITMRTPVAGWMINDNQYYVDSDGISFEQNYFLPPSVQIVDNSGASLQTGTAIASKRFLSFVGRVVSLAQTSGYTVTQAILPANTTRELEISLKDVSFSVKLSIDRSAGEQVEDMSRAVQYFISNGRAPNYIDVRVSGKAFYR